MNTAKMKNEISNKKRRKYKIIHDKDNNIAPIIGESKCQ